MNSRKLKAIFVLAVSQEQCTFTNTMYPPVPHYCDYTKLKFIPFVDLAIMNSLMQAYIVQRSAVSVGLKFLRKLASNNSLNFPNVGAFAPSSHSAQ